MKMILELQSRVVSETELHKTPVFVPYRHILLSLGQSKGSYVHTITKNILKVSNHIQKQKKNVQKITEQRGIRTPADYSTRMLIVKR
jgi:hypothetical protein